MPNRGQRNSVQEELPRYKHAEQLVCQGMQFSIANLMRDCRSRPASLVGGAWKAVSKVRGGQRALQFIRKAIILGGGSVQRAQHEWGGEITIDLRSGTEWMMYFRRNYDAGAVAIMIRVLKSNPGQFLDIGANIGFYSIPIALNIDPGRVVCFEPGSGNHSRLKRNLEFNRLTASVEVHKVALSDKERSEMLTLREDYQSGSCTGNASIASNSNMDEGFQTEEIRLTRLDNFRGEKDDTIAIIKMDIEGHEPEAMSGATRTIETHLPIIFCEVNAPFLRAKGVNPGRALSKILPYGYTPFAHIEGRSEVSLSEARWSHLDAVEGVANFWLVPSQKRQWLSNLDV